LHIAVRLSRGARRPKARLASKLQPARAAHGTVGPTAIVLPAAANAYG